MEDTHDATCAPDQERALRTFDDIVGWFTHAGGVDHVPPAPARCEAPYVFVNDVRLRAP